METKLKIFSRVVLLIVVLLFPMNVIAQKYKVMYSQQLLAAAQKGDPEAQFTLAKCYSDGKGVAKNKEKAFEWTKKAAEQDYLDAVESLPWLYLTGKGIKADTVQYRNWLMRGSKLGIGRASYNIGWNYEYGFYGFV